MGILEGKRILITGVLTDDSLAFGVAKLAQEEGAEVILSGAGRGMRLTQRSARKLPSPAEVLAMDVTIPEEMTAVAEVIAERWGRLDGMLHAIAFAPPECLGGDIFGATWEQAQVAIHVSAYSLKAMIEAFRPLLVASGAQGGPGASVVCLDFDATRVWPAYNWMGVAKAALESLTRYLARDLGADRVRVNMVAAGPIRTIAAKSIPDFALMEHTWENRAPLGWSVLNPEAVARATVALMSDWFPMTTGEMLHVDGGVHILGI